jgi:hypothetical protein
MTWIRSVSLFLLMASAVGCSSVKIGYDHDPSANFSAYHTYDWVPGPQDTTGDRRVDNSLVDIRMRTAIAAQLSVKGYTKPANGQPDFYVAYHVAVKDMVKGSAAKYYTGDRNVGTWTTVSDIQAYEAGTLLVDIVDASSKQLVWRGSAFGEVDPGLTSQERDERIRNLVHKMFSHFPPQ